MTTATATKPATFKSEILGTVVLNTYVDPYPGKVGTDKAPVPCGRCGGKGRIDAFSHVLGGVCFGCNGHGVQFTTVATLRKHAKAEAFAAEYGDQIAAYWAEVDRKNAEAAKAAEYAAAWDEAHKEAARRAAMVQGFVGEVGDKVKGLVGTVQVAKYTAAQRYGWSASMFIIVTLDNGQVLKFSGSGESLFGVARGDKVTVAGAVKDQQVYNGQQQTVLTRVKLAKVEEADEAPAPVEAPAVEVAPVVTEQRVADVLNYFGLEG